VKLYSALKKSFVRVPRRVVVGGFYVWVCGGLCVWGGVYLCQDVEGCFLQDGCDFRVCHVCEGLWGNFFPKSWACNFWMKGVIRDTFLANALVNAFLVSLSLRCLEWYRVRGGDD